MARLDGTPKLCCLFHPAQRRRDFQFGRIVWGIEDERIEGCVSRCIAFACGAVALETPSFAGVSMRGAGSDMPFEKSQVIFPTSQAMAKLSRQFSKAKKGGYGCPG